MSNGDEQERLEKEKVLAQLRLDIKNLQAGEAEAQKKIAEAEKAIRDATFPRGTTEPLKGDITTDGKANYPAEIIAYKVMYASAQKIAEVVSKCAGENTKILIVDELRFAQGDLPLVQLRNQFESFKKLFKDQTKDNKDILKKAPNILQSGGVMSDAMDSFSLPTILSATTGIVSSVVDILSYFQVNYGIKGIEVKLDIDALTAIVAGAIVTGFKDTPKPEVYIFNFNLINNTTINDDLTKRLEQRQTLAYQRELLQSRVVEPTTALLKDSDDENLKKELTKSLTEAQDAMGKSEALGKTFDAFFTLITSTPDPKIPSLLAQAALRDHITTVGITHLLHLKVLSSGGVEITKQNSFPIFNPNKVIYIGGSAISYILADVTKEANGKIVLADTWVGMARLDGILDTPNYVKIQEFGKVGTNTS